MSTVLHFEWPGVGFLSAVSKDDWFISLFIEIFVTEDFTIIACIVKWDDGTYMP